MFSKKMYIYTYVYKSFSTTLDKIFRKDLKKKKEEMEKLENINGSTENEIEKVKQTKK